LQTVVADQVIEARLDEEDQAVSRVSTPTLMYMYRYGVALECRLRSHRGNLEHVAGEEYDLFEGMKLSSRLRNVGQNISRTGRRNDAMRSELVRRQADEDRSDRTRSTPFALYMGGETC
jgi:hypothetical protein